MQQLVSQQSKAQEDAKKKGMFSGLLSGTKMAGKAPPPKPTPQPAMPLQPAQPTTHQAPPADDFGGFTTAAQGVHTQLTTSASAFAF